MFPSFECIAKGHEEQQSKMLELPEAIRPERLSFLTLFNAWLEVWIENPVHHAFNHNVGKCIVCR